MPYAPAEAKSPDADLFITSNFTNKIVMKKLE